MDIIWVMFWKAKRLRIFVVSFSLSIPRAKRFGAPSWILDTAVKVTDFLHRINIHFRTHWVLVNNVIMIQANKCEFKFNTSIFISLTVLIMLFRCVFQTFYENLHNFWTKIYFFIKFGDLVSKHLLFKPWKCEIKILIFGWVIAISLGVFFWATL